VATPKPLGNPGRDDYFVRVGVSPVAPPAAPPSGSGTARSYEPAGGEPPRRRRRRRISKRPIALWCLLLALGGWFAWASQQPGGVSGTVNGFVDHLRGDVEDLSGGRGLKQATDYYNGQYSATGTYPVLNENQQSAANIGLDVDIVNCSPQAVVLQTVTVSRLLVSGTNLGDVSGRVGCPTDLGHPDPWKLKS
jgi:hypothetical protein